MDHRESTVGQAGEDAVLTEVMEIVAPFNARRGAHLLLGPGADDAALLVPRPGSQLVLTTDTMSQDQDFRPCWWSGPEQLAAGAFEPPDEYPMEVGTKAAAQNLSDISAMGAQPTALLISLTLPRTMPLTWVADFYRGVVRACEQPGAQRCVIAGGDLGRGDVVSVTITAVGELAAGSAGLRRDAAAPGDTLAVCGPLGRAAAGLALLEESSGPEGGTAISPQQQELFTHHEELFGVCMRAQTRPAPPLEAGPAALAAGGRGGMDISDGLLRDAARLARASGVDIHLDDDVLAEEARTLEPVAAYLGRPPEQARHQALTWVMGGGEEYALLGTFPAGVVLPEGFRRIGEVREKADGVPRVVTGHVVSNVGWSSL
ncbi:thiamine-phosphate kinase [Nesterenkonia flava]|uniref:Thiamine-monophosphate kinase n=1 Tax=Nesterenkonia flava TaxID=469799 RepID=A0ABU1FRT4_9MICC|nr:thiamine-phosphate kinase [Nesterenkonia flava]MDR5711360.1 thiamine-phosphate kinase [Nesterenkonia flava]